MSDIQFNENFNKLIQPLIDNSLASFGKSLKQIFEERERELKMSRSQLEKLLNIEKKTLNGILDKTTKRVDLVNILKLAVFLNLKTDQLIELYINEMSPDLVGEIEKTRKSNYLASNFDLEQLYKIKFLSKRNSILQIENKLINFFGLRNIFEYTHNFQYPVFSRPKSNSNNKMRDFWIKSAIIQFEMINNSNTYDRQALVELIPKIKPYTMNIEKGLMIVARALYNIGVTVIFQRSLPSVSVRGATMVLNGKPCVIITDLYKRYPTLWFALMHEIHHVLYDIDELKQKTYHLSGEPDLFLLNEDAANGFARNYFLNEEKTQYIAPLIKNEFLVNEYAKKIQIHPSIIYQFIMHDRKELSVRNAYNQIYNKRTSEDVKLALKNFNMNPWEKNTILEAVEELKKTVYNLN